MVAWSCKEHKIDTLLMEADRIQHEAIDIGLKADSILDVRLAEGTNQWNIDSLRILKSNINLWRSEMIAIPGINHSHEGHDHEGHDHEGHDHANEISVVLSPSDIKKAQEEWMSAIKIIYDSLK